MRFLYFCDSQLSSKQPKRRLDDINEVNQDKFNRLATIYNEVSCEFTVCGGDLFDYYAPDIDSLKIVNRYISKTGKMYFIPGNHDLPPGAHPRSFNKTIFSVVMEASNGMISFINDKFTLRTETGKSVEFAPIHYTRDFGKYLVIPTDADFLVIIAHILLGERNFETKAQDIITNADLFLVGHTHFFFKKEINGTTFFNPAALIRRRTNEAEVIPSCGIVDISDKITVRRIKIGAPNANFKEKAESEELDIYEDSEELGDFVKSLGDVAFDIDFDTVLKKTIATLKPSSNVTKIIHKLIDEYKEGD